MQTIIYFIKKIIKFMTRDNRTEHYIYKNQISTNAYKTYTINEAKRRYQHLNYLPKTWF